MYFNMEIVDMQLDATTELETASQFRIRGYPTVLLIYKVEFYIICNVVIRFYVWRLSPSFWYGRESKKGVGIM